MVSSGSVDSAVSANLCGMVPDAVSLRTTIVEQARMAEGTYRIRVAAPALAAQIVPGQFFMIRSPGSDPLLGRPFALYDTVPDAEGDPAASLGARVSPGAAGDLRLDALRARLEHLG